MTGSHIEIEEQSCDFERSDKIDNKLVDVTEAKIESVATSFRIQDVLTNPFDDSIYLDAQFPSHIQSSNIYKVETILKCYSNWCCFIFFF